MRGNQSWSIHTCIEAQQQNCHGAIDSFLVRLSIAPLISMCLRMLVVEAAVDGPMYSHVDTTNMKKKKNFHVDKTFVLGD